MLVTDHDSGGYDMDDSEIGVVLMAAAVLQLMFQVHINTLYNIYVYFANLAHFEGFKDLSPTQELMIVPTQLIHFIPPPSFSSYLSTLGLPSALVTVALSFAVFFCLE